MESDAMEVMQQLECFSTAPIDETAESPVEGDERDEFDHLWIDIGGEG